MPPSEPQAIAELRSLVADLNRRLDEFEDPTGAHAFALRLARAHAAGLADQLETIVPQFDAETLPSLRPTKGRDARGAPPR